MELKRPGGIRTYILLLVCLLSYGIALFPALAAGKRKVLKATTYGLGSTKRRDPKWRT